MKLIIYFKKKYASTADIYFLKDEILMAKSLNNNLIFIIDYIKTIFKYNEPIVFIREVPFSVALLSYLLNRKIFCLIDDNYESGFSDNSLLTKYRFKLIRLYLLKCFFKFLKGTVICSSENLQNKNKNSCLLYPVLNAYPDICKKINIISKNANKDIINVIYFATASHTEDFNFVLNLLKKISNKNMSLTIIGPEQYRSSFEEYNAIFIKNMPYQDFKKYIIKEQFDYILLPNILRQTSSFNKYRSISKLLQAVSLFGKVITNENSIYEKYVIKYSLGLVLDNKVETWAAFFNKLLNFDSSLEYDLTKIKANKFFTEIERIHRRQLNNIFNKKIL